MGPTLSYKFGNIIADRTCLRHACHMLTSCLRHAYAMYVCAFLQAALAQGRVEQTASVQQATSSAASVEQMDQEWEAQTVKPILLFAPQEVTQEDAKEEVKEEATKEVKVAIEEEKQLWSHWKAPSQQSQSW